jgi:hypothetical protein
MVCDAATCGATWPNWLNRCGECRRAAGSHSQGAGASRQLLSIRHWLITKLISLYPYHWRHQGVFLVVSVFHFGN